MSSEQQAKTLSHLVVEITTYSVGMLSARTSTVHFCSRQNEATLTGLPLLCSSGSTRNAEIDATRPFRLSIFSHSSPKAWSLLNNLTGRTWRSPCHCAVLANAIASEMIRRLETADTRVLTVSHLDSPRKKCQIFGGILQQV